MDPSADMVSKNLKGKAVRSEYRRASLIGHELGLEQIIESGNVLVLLICIAEVHQQREPESSLFPA